jgi:formate hydrogenlyase subunit 6/NADH:ubiquinone oxidoreductase subunit I
LAAFFVKQAGSLHHKRQLWCSHLGCHLHQSRLEAYTTNGNCGAAILATFFVKQAGSLHHKGIVCMPTRRKRLLQWIVRLTLLALAIATAGIGWFPSSVGKTLPAWIARIFPSMSPLMAFGGAMGGRRWTLGFLWAFPGIFLLGVALFRGRFFCRWICPAGTIYNLPRRLSAKKHLLRHRLSGHLFWAIVGSSLAGAPILFFFDPLSTFGRIAVPAPFTSLMIKGAYSAVLWIPAFLIPLFLLLGCFQPLIWCTHFCPLGYTFELALLFRQHQHKALNRTRREILGGLAIGVPFALLMRRFGVPRASTTSKPRYPVLPPGARDPGTFSVLCARCYTCVNVCPTKVLRVPSPTDRKVGEWFQPELDTVASYCKEFCAKCSEVCPAGAIAPLSQEVKHRTRIGLAAIERKTCLGWSYGQYCMVCDEYCPYNAIDTVMSDKGVPQPVVNLEKCRGCGSCQYACPGGDGKTKAIVIHGVAKQTQLEESGKRSAP